MKSFVEHSQVYSPYLYGLSVVFLGMIFYAAKTIFFIVSEKSIPWMDILTQLIVWCFMLSIILGRSCYELKDKEIVLTNKNPFRHRVVSVPYKAINGVHPFQVQLVKTVAYRYTFRMYANLDNRPIWSLIYNLPGEKKDRIARVLMKASEPFWEAFEEKVPGKIRIPQEEALHNTYRHMQKYYQKDELPKEIAPSEHFEKK